MSNFVPGEHNTLSLIVPLKGDGQQQLGIGWMNAEGMSPTPELRIHWIKFFDGDGKARVVNGNDRLVPAGDPWWGASGDKWGVAKSGEVLVGIEYSFSCPVNEHGHPRVGAVVGFREA